MKQAIAKLLYTKREIMMDIKAAGAAAGNVGGRPDSGPPEHFNVQPPNDISLVVNSLYSIVGERLIGTTPPPRPQNNKAKHCQRCIDYRQDGYDCGGRGGWKCCAYFEADSAKILPEGNAKCKMQTMSPVSGENAWTCKRETNQNQCTYYISNGHPMQQKVNFQLQESQIKMKY